MGIRGHERLIRRVRRHADLSVLLREGTSGRPPDAQSIDTSGIVQATLWSAPINFPLSDAGREVSPADEDVLSTAIHQVEATSIPGRSTETQDRAWLPTNPVAPPSAPTYRPGPEGIVQELATPPPFGSTPITQSGDTPSESAATDEEDPIWRRLQSILRRHREQEPGTAQQKQTSTPGQSQRAAPPHPDTDAAMESDPSPPLQSRPTETTTPPAPAIQRHTTSEHPAAPPRPDTGAAMESDLAFSPEARVTDEFGRAVHTADQPLPLQAVWPMEAVSSNKPSSDELVAPPSILAPLRLPMVDDEKIQQALLSVAVGQHTTSTVELVLPRRARPVTSVAVETRAAPPVNKTGLSGGAPVEQTADVGEITHHRSAKEMVNREIQTEIGPLPADLWETLGESPPTTTPAAEASLKLSPSKISPGVVQRSQTGRGVSEVDEAITLVKVGVPPLTDPTTLLATRGEVGREAEAARIIPGVTAPSATTGSEAPTARAKFEPPAELGTDTKGPNPPPEKQMGHPTDTADVAATVMAAEALADRPALIITPDAARGARQCFLAAEDEAGDEAEAGSEAKAADAIADVMAQLAIARPETPMEQFWPTLPPRPGLASPEVPTPDVQRRAEDNAPKAVEPDSPKSGEVDLEDLTYQVYGEIRRRLTLEWERTRGRFS